MDTKIQKMLKYILIVTTPFLVYFFFLEPMFNLGFRLSDNFLAKYKFLLIYIQTFVIVFYPVLFIFWMYLRKKNSAGIMKTQENISDKFVLIGGGALTIFVLIIFFFLAVLYRAFCEPNDLFCG